MKTTILLKLLTLMLILTLFPLGILGYLSIKDVIKMENSSLKNIKEINETVITDSTNSLNELGTIIIKNQAISTKKLIEQYIKNNPEKTAADIMADPMFQALAIQPVGSKGYTTVVLTKTQTMLAHPNTALVGREMLASKDKPEMKDWWRVVENTWTNNVDSQGYYKWPEKDGTYSDKYMYLAVLDEKIEGKEVSVAATTYTDEFNAPAKNTKEKLNSKAITIEENIKKTRADIQKSTIQFIIIMLLATIFAAILFAKTISSPIKKLKIAADKITSGDFTAELPKTKSNDEVSSLTSSMEMLIATLKNKK